MTIVNFKTKEQMLVSVLDGLQRNAGINSISPGSIARAFAETINSEIYDLYNSLRLSVEQSNLSTAGGMRLDMIGALYGVNRRTITEELAMDRLSGNIEFFTNRTHSSDILIPAKTLIYNDTTSHSSVQYTYELFGDVVISSGNTRAYGSVKAKFPDNNIVAPRNTLIRHNFMSPPGVVVFCNNPKEVYSSLNSESDDNYRRRIIAKIRGSGSGSAESLRFAALGIKGVRDVKIREASFGIGSCDVIIVPETRSGIASLMQLVMGEIRAIKPIGININVRIAERKTVDVNMSISLRKGTSSATARSVENQVRIFVHRYLNSLLIGDSLIVSEIERNAKLASDVVVSAEVKLVKVDDYRISNKEYTLADDRSYMVAGSLGIYSVIIGNSNY
jgi:uncharacterized phage protein gp47/JayE